MRVDVDATLTGRPQRQQGSGRRTARQMVRERRRLPSEWWCPSVLTMARSVRCPTTETIKSLKFSIRRAGQSGLGCGVMLFQRGLSCGTVWFATLRWQTQVFSATVLEFADLEGDHRVVRDGST